MTARDKQIKRYAGIAYANAMKHHMDVWDVYNELYDKVLEDANAEFETLCEKFLVEENASKNEHMYLLTTCSYGTNMKTIYRDKEQAFDDARKARKKMLSQYEVFDSYKEHCHVDKEKGKYWYEMVASENEEEEEEPLFLVHVERIKVL